MEVPTICKAYVRGYTPKIWPYMVQYLHFRILKFPLTICQISVSRSKFPKFPPLRPGCFGSAMAPVGASSAPRCAPRPGTAARAGCRRRGRNCRRRGRRRNEALSWTLEPWVPLSLTYGKYMGNIWEIYGKHMGNIYIYMTSSGHAIFSPGADSIFCPPNG